MLKARADRFESLYQLSSYCLTVAREVLDRVKGVAIPDVGLLVKCLGQLEAIGLAFSKYDVTDFGSYNELKPLMVVISARNAIQSNLEGAIRKTEHQVIGKFLQRELEKIIPALEEELAPLRKLADDARDLVRS